ncbi:MAG: DUF1439 domain-containing protein [Burkholderiaceae bacterium]|nr:DUF1439 domain-containing protein [Burkholderiaceae bacterium]
MSPALTRRSLLGACIALASCSQGLVGVNFFSGEYTITRQELQELVARSFPLTRRYGALFSVSLSDPRLSLDAAANRIAVAVRVSIASVLLPQPAGGQITLSGALRYDPSTRTLRLDQPNAEHIALDGVTGQDAQHLQRIGAGVAQQLLQGQALHTFRPDELTVGLKTYEIGAITVHEDSVSVQLK